MSADPAGDETLHVSEDLGLWIPADLREFDQQVVFRTPRGTVQHFGSQPLDAYYGLIDESSFGDPDEFRNCRNPELAPDRVSIKPQGEEPQVFEVDDVGR